MTSEGRALEAVLLIFGLGLLASTTGAIASWVLKQLRDSEAENTARELIEAAPSEKP
jgi:hypothetical protein